jgi:hypothetical protein
VTIAKKQPGTIVVILGTLHQLQGPSFSGSVEDPSYSKLLKRLISDRSIDFVFEEAAGRRPTTAELIAQTEVSGHYLDVDPTPEERKFLGIEAASIPQEPIDIWDHPHDQHTEQIIEEHCKREKVWLERVGETAFKKGLLICGIAHGLGFGFKLKDAGYEVTVFEYLPHHKVCMVVPRS